ERTPIRFRGKFARTYPSIFGSWVFNFRSQDSHHLHAVMIDQADSVETIRHDFGTGEPFAHELAVRAGEVDTDHSHLVAPLQAGEKARKLLFAFTRLDIEDAVVAQISESGAETLLFMESM